ncbi:MAG: polysaccharide deacetylase family protein [Lachnospiraceae bacterium]
MQKYQKGLIMIGVIGIMLAVVIAVYPESGTGRETDAVKASEIEVDTELNTETQEETDQTAKKIALTFDDGPEEGSTDVLLDGLKERGVKATFFVIGKCAERNPELIKRMDAEGHLMGNHTYSHVDIAHLDDASAIEEIEITNDIIEEIIGKPTEFVRPPFGAWQENLEQKMDVIPVMWTVDPLDWTTDNVDEIVNKVVTKTEDGDIILLHDCYLTSVKAAFRIIDLLSAQGYEFVTVDELILN